MSRTKPENEGQMKGECYKPRLGQSLSVREIQVYKLVVEHGLSDKEIAEKLFLSVRTAKYHKSRIFTKLGFNSALQMTVSHYQSKTIAA